MTRVIQYGEDAVRAWLNAENGSCLKSTFIVVRFAEPDLGICRSDLIQGYGRKGDALEAFRRAGTYPDAAVVCGFEWSPTMEYLRPDERAEIYDKARRDSATAFRNRMDSAPCGLQDAYVDGKVDPC